MRKKNGFIAISLIYSFFLVFLLTLVTIMVNYVHNRILLNDVKVVIQDKLNGLSEFYPVTVENKTYQVNDTISYANDNWKVIQDLGASVLLILDRGLNNTELKSSLGAEYHSAISNDTINMCLNGYDPLVCCYKSASVLDYNLYDWDTSLVKKVVDSWLQNNGILQRAIARGKMEQMTFSDGNKSSTISTYTAYIRIPTNNEYPSTGQTAWNLTSDNVVNGQSYIKVNNSSHIAHTVKKQVRPVIQVKKAT